MRARRVYPDSVDGPRSAGSGARPLDILFCCCTLGIVNRGIESFFREAYDNLKLDPRVAITLAKGRGESKGREITLRSVPIDSTIARMLGAMLRRTPHTVHQWTSSIHVLYLIIRGDPDVVYSSDGNLLFALALFRRFIRFRATLLFSNGGPCSPPFTRFDGVHQVAPYYSAMAELAGEPAWKQRMVPYGFTVDKDDSSLPRALGRQALGLPVDRFIVLSVGWISACHKRMDYVVREVAALENRPFLVLIGHIDETSSQIRDLADSLLGSDSYVMRSVSHSEVSNYYKTADLFVLASLREGFGRVYLEALSHGLPVIAHDHPVTQFVLGRYGHFADLTIKGSLSTAIVAAMKGKISDQTCERRQYVEQHFSWGALRDEYIELFHYFAYGLGSITRLNSSADQL